MSDIEHTLSQQAQSHSTVVIPPQHTVTGSTELSTGESSRQQPRSMSHFSPSQLTYSGSPPPPPPPPSLPPSAPPSSPVPPHHTRAQPYPLPGVLALLTGDPCEVGPVNLQRCLSLM
ncbi:hypothetical protein ABVT39_027425 [Epinephelus coioides]